MITDRLQLSGLEAYLRTAGNPSTLNLASTIPSRCRTVPLSKGRQAQLSGLQLLIEANDLRPLFQFQRDPAGAPKPLFQISVTKEMFSGLFADVFRHRVHNIAGALDFREGTLQNAHVLEIEGVPTICAAGRKECCWVSRTYLLPDPISIAAVAWELASSRLALPESFKYRIDLDCFDAFGGIFHTITTGSLIKPDRPRFQLDHVDEVHSFRATFTARVGQDSYMVERQLPTLDKGVGRPLLRAINVLESISSSVYDVHSLTELRSRCDRFELSESPGPAITRLLATLDMSVVLVQSDNEDIDAGLYESVDIDVLTDTLDVFEVRQIGDILTRVR